MIERTDPRHVRAQAFTLFVGAYDECRRGVEYLRWHEGDAAEIVPSLYPRRGGRAKVVADSLLDAGSGSEPEDQPAPMPGAVASTVAEAVVSA